MRQRGFSVFELVVSLGLVAILVGIFLERAVYYQEWAEKTAMEQVALDLRSSVNLKVAELVLANRHAELAALPGQNPMELLGAPPANYRGPIPAGQAPVGGQWYFDHKVKEIVYYIDLGRYFSSEKDGLKKLSWRIVLVASTAEPGKPVWARLELVTPYRWF